MPKIILTNNNFQGQKQVIDNIIQDLNTLHSVYSKLNKENQDLVKEKFKILGYIEDNLIPTLRKFQ